MYLQLHRGEKVEIDEVDRERACQHLWYVRSNGQVMSSNGRILLHRFLVGATNQQVVLFKDGNFLNCKRSNLVILPKGSVLPYSMLGITFQKGRWIARFRGKYLGSFKTELEARAARRSAEG